MLIPVYMYMQSIYDNLWKP